MDITILGKFSTSQLKALDSLVGALITDERIKKSSYLDNLSLKIEPYIDRTKKLESMQNNYAKVNTNSKMISINTESNYFSLKQSHQIAIILHEIGHIHYANQTDEDHLSYNLEGLAGKIHNEANVDFIVCCWGFDEELIDERKNSYGNDYADALKSFRDDGFANRIQTVVNRILTT
jgi:hypothetical protein